MFTSEEYFVWEEQQLEKYELIEGEVYAMTGGSVNHGRLAIRLTALSDDHLDAGPCMTRNSDIKINIAGTSNYTYPDANVTCDDQDKNTLNHFTYPCLIVEVLSQSTADYDRGRKFFLYQKNPSLVDYLLVSSTSVEIDLHHKNEAGDWMMINYQVGDTVDLRSIDLRFPIEQIYHGLPLSPEDHGK